MAELLALACTAGIIWFWIDSLRAREAAHAAGRRACEQEGLMFLDDTVSIAGLGLTRNASGQAVIRRRYTFEFSDTGDNRRQGEVEVVGRRPGTPRLEPHRFLH